MAKTVVGLYDDSATAKKVVRELEQTGFGKDHLRTTSREKGFKSDYGVDAGKVNPEYLSRHGIPEEEADFYAEGVRRGGSLVIARVHDDDAQTAADIMARYSPVQYENRLADYKKRGYTGHEVGSKPYTEAEIREERERYQTEGEQHVPIVEEDVRVGKREVNRGGVRVHTHVVEETEEVPVRLRDETIRVETRKTDRAATEADLADAFQDRTIEVTETDEEAVVSKEARVTGEVVVDKGVEERTETVRENVRHTEVDVDETGATTSGRAYADFDEDFRSHHRTAYGSSGGGYETYEPAYRYGYESANDPRYRGRSFEKAEADLRSDYDKRHNKGAFDKAKDAVRHAYNRARH